MKLSLLTKTEIAGSQAGGRVDFRKVGKLNRNKAVEKSALGPEFRADATALLEHYGCKYYIKSAADSYCVFDGRQVAVVGEEMVKCGKRRARCAA